MEEIKGPSLQGDKEVGLWRSGGWWRVGGREGRRKTPISFPEILLDSNQEIWEVQTVRQTTQWSTHQYHIFPGGVLSGS